MAWLTFDMIKDPALYGNVINILGMILYVCLDYERGYITNNHIFGTAGFIVGAIVFVIDALLYWAAWEGSNPHPDLTAIVAEYLNIAGSLVYLQTSFLYDSEATNVMLADAVYIMEAFATLLFFASACLGFLGWMLAFNFPSIIYRNDGEGIQSMEKSLLDGDKSAKQSVGRRINCSTSAMWATTSVIMKDIDFWANIMNMMPALVYVISSTGTLQLHFESRDDLLQASVQPSLANHMPAHSSDQTINATTLTETATAGMAVYAMSHAVSGLFRRLGGLRQSAIPSAAGAGANGGMSRGRDQMQRTRLDRLSGSTIASGILASPSTPPRGLPAHGRLLQDRADNLRRPNLLVSMSRAYVVGDILWTIDAIICTISWYRGWMDSYDSPAAEFGSNSPESSAAGVQSGRESGAWQVLVDGEEDQLEGYHVLLCLHKPVARAWGRAWQWCKRTWRAVRDPAGAAASARRAVAGQSEDLYGAGAGAARGSRIGSEGWSRAIETGGW